MLKLHLFLFRQEYQLSLSDEETMQGAINRAKRALEEGEAPIGIGLEGVMKTEHGLFMCNWGALATMDGKVFRPEERVLRYQTIFSTS